MRYCETPFLYRASQKTHITNQKHYSAKLKNWTFEKLNQIKESKVDRKYLWSQCSKKNRMDNWGL